MVKVATVPSIAQTKHDYNGATEKDLTEENVEWNMLVMQLFDIISILLCCQNNAEFDALQFKKISCYL